MTVLWSKCDLRVSKTTLYHLVHLSVIISLWDSESLLILRASVSWTNEIEVKPEKKTLLWVIMCRPLTSRWRKTTLPSLLTTLLNSFYILLSFCETQKQAVTHTISRNADWCGEETGSGWGFFFSEIELSMVVNLTHFRWGILFSHPRDYTPVCTTELGRAARLSTEFSKRNVKMIALSVDFLEDHHGWAKVL